MKTLFAIILLALMLTACATDKLTDCPPPAGELLVPPAPLPKLDDTKAMGEGDYVTATLNDFELFQIQRNRLIELQRHGETACHWPVAKD